MNRNSTKMFSVKKLMQNNKKEKSQKRVMHMSTRLPSQFKIVDSITDHKKPLRVYSNL